MKKSFIKAAFVAVFASIANYGVYTSQQKVEMLDLEWPMWKRWLINLNECPHVPKLAKFKPPRCPIGVYWNTLCLMRDVWTIKTYMI